MEVDKEEWSEIKDKDEVEVKKKVKVITYSVFLGGVHSFEVIVKYILIVKQVSSTVIVLIL